MVPFPFQVARIVLLSVMCITASSSRNENSGVTDVEVHKGTTLKLSCPITSNIDPSSVQWRRSIGPLDNPFQWEWVEAETHGTIVINQLQAQLTVYHVSTASAQRQYQCTIGRQSEIDFPGFILATFRVKVMKSSLEASAHQVTAYEGESVTLQCSATGYVFWVTWHYFPSSGPEIMINTYRKTRITAFRKNNNHMLTIFPVQKSDEGKYKCRGHSDDVDDDSVFLIVKTLPTIRRESLASVQRQVIGRRLEVTCEVEATDSVTLFWKHNNATFNSTRSSKHGKALTLVFEVLKKENGGIYKCVAKSDKHKSDYDVTIRVLDPPVAPKNVTIQFNCTWGFTVRWLPEHSSESLAADEYSVEYVTDNFKAIVLPELHKQRTKATFTEIPKKDFCNLSVVYFVQVQAINLEFNSSSVPSKASSVKGYKSSSKYAALFPVQLPSIQIRLVRNCCRCIDEEKITSKHIDAALRILFKYRVEIIQNLLTPQNNLSFAIRFARGRAYLIEYQGYLSDKISAAKLVVVLSDLKRKLEKRLVHVARNLYLIDINCMLTYWKGASCPCQLEKQKNIFTNPIENLRCSEAKKAFRRRHAIYTCDTVVDKVSMID